MLDDSMLERMDEMLAKRKEVACTEPWEHPDPLKEWESSGLSCMLIFGPHSNINGYVTVPKSHPLHGIHYSDCPKKDCSEEWCDHSPEIAIEVHGGITFSNLGRDGGWIFGFDTSHYGDYTPYMLGSDGRVWSDVEVATETESMAKQLAEWNG